MTAGTYVFVPKEMPHFALAQGETILQAYGVGPFQIIYADPADDPRNQRPRLASVTLEGFKEVNAKINALVDFQMRTDENPRNLVAVVDRYFSEGRNGR